MLRAWRTKDRLTSGVGLDVACPTAPEFYRDGLRVRVPSVVSIAALLNIPLRGAQRLCSCGILAALSEPLGQRHCQVRVACIDCSTPRPYPGWPSSPWRGVSTTAPPMVSPPPHVRRRGEHVSRQSASARIRRGTVHLRVWGRSPAGASIACRCQAIDIFVAARCRLPTCAR